DLLGEEGAGGLGGRAAPGGGGGCVRAGGELELGEDAVVVGEARAGAVAEVDLVGEDRRDRAAAHGPRGAAAGEDPVDPAVRSRDDEAGEADHEVEGD